MYIKNNFIDWLVLKSVAFNKFSEFITDNHRSLSTRCMLNLCFFNEFFYSKCFWIKMSWFKMTADTNCGNKIVFFNSICWQRIDAICYEKNVMWTLKYAFIIIIKKKKWWNNHFYECQLFDVFHSVSQT